VGKQKGRVQAIVQCHPAFAAASDYAEVKVPISILAAPSDGIGNFTELLKMRRKEDHLKYYLKIFAGLQHGFTIRYDVNNKTAVAKANQAHRLLLKWFHKYL
jgi:dienelactone hydrolase